MGPGEEQCTASRHQAAATGCFEGMKGSEKSRFGNLVSKILFKVKHIFVVILVSCASRFSFPEP